MRFGSRCFWSLSTGGKSIGTPLVFFVKVQVSLTERQIGQSRNLNGQYWLCTEISISDTTCENHDFPSSYRCRRPNMKLSRHHRGVDSSTKVYNKLLEGGWGLHSESRSDLPIGNEVDILGVFKPPHMITIHHRRRVALCGCRASRGVPGWPQQQRGPTKPLQRRGGTVRNGG